MRIHRQSLCEEELVTGSHHSTIVQIHVIHKEPRPDTVGLQRTALLNQLHVILIEEQSRLVFRVGSHIMGRTVPEMTEAPVTHFIQTTLTDTRLHIRHQIHPEGDLRPVERCLLDDTLGTVCHISHNHIVGLIGSITEEVTLENRLSPL